MVGFYLKDPGPSAAPIQTGNTRSLFLNDITWMGIRKGGDRFWAPFKQGGVWKLLPMRTDSTTIIASPFPVLGMNAVQGTPEVRGMTNNKKQLVLIVQDGAVAVADRLQYNDTDGTLLGSFALSDVPIGKSRQLVYLNHDYYVLRDAQEGLPDGAISVYDARGAFIRRWLLPAVPDEAPVYRGITTDGKNLYIIRTDTPNQVLLKFDTSGKLLRTYSFFSEGAEVPRGVITFDGRYLLTQTFVPG